jgi:hypothetical protein
MGFGLRVDEFLAGLIYYFPIGAEF